MRALFEFRCASLKTVSTLLATAVFGLCSAQISIKPMPAQFFQTNKVVPPARQATIPPAVSVSTDDFFPQIRKVTVSRRIQKEHKGAISRRITSLKNNLRPGGLTDLATARVGVNFVGLDSQGYVPPDPIIGVGPNHIVEGVNLAIGIFDKSGNKLFEQSTFDFYSGLAPIIGSENLTFFSDPRVVYDPLNSRYIVDFLSLNEDGERSFQVVAVSDDSDPMGTWLLYGFETTITINSIKSWMDYPMMACNGDMLVIGGNMFSFTDFSFTGSALIAVPIAGLYSGAGGTATTFTIPDEFGFHPANGPGGNFIYGLSAYSSTSIKLFAISTNTDPPVMTTSLVSVPSYSPIFFSAPSGSGGLNDTLSDRILSAKTKGTQVFGTHSINSGDNRSSVRWYEFNMNSWPVSGSPTLTQSGTITLPSGQWAYMGAIAVNAINEVSVIYTRSSTTINGDLVVSTRKPGDPPGTLGTPFLLKASTSPNPYGRWGDYFGVDPDPIDGQTFWGVGEIQKSFDWTTEIQSWEVSPVVGPGYDATSVTTYIGSFLSGGLGDVIANDSSAYKLSSTLVPGQGQYGAVRADFVVPENPSTMRKLTFTLDAALAPGTSATATLFLYNFRTAKYDYAKAFSLGQLSGDAIQTFVLKSAFSDYVSGSGGVRAVLRAHAPFRRNGGTPSPFTLATDWFHLNVLSTPQF